MAALLPIDRYLGCLLGLAVGDALGAPVEFLTLHEIHLRFGPAGVVTLQGWSGFPRGTFTDDTQMSLATARGLIRAHTTKSDLNTETAVRSVYDEYLRWLASQVSRRLRRAPGTTCVSALGSGVMGSVDKPINTSKGCGGVMRVAPIGLACRREMAFSLGVEVASITHGHPSGYLPAGVLADLVAGLRSGCTLTAALDEAVSHLIAYPGHEETLCFINMAREQARVRCATSTALQKLGEGWTGESALAIALYCSLHSPNNWSDAVLTAVNHSGDSDSTGSMTGAILGTLLGIDAIPPSWVKSVECGDEIRRTAHDMFNTFETMPTSE